ncbi:hypothetical protein M409DRAFT_21779 [Zasmidium cellare ATCC 36951]|uniref:Uncharacterized protein n=1 Tax=Zasmidium cellare ATCC 36951 TaxID=1080233 RepID=A0A6A6CMG2_ZASCE|nr:uncharacterized protein M409DRAFT_21779 [Zasmidium cellare ATCC 36951]KAF2168345.1 hypothetical protein M409DRAFT_21779 [Zasmidium cellare ATCC 36951]
MIHEDGIEVYLKPHGTENEDVKFAEFPPRDFESFEGEGEERNKRCLILAHQGNFDVVVRCHPHFKMYSASGLHTTIRDGRQTPHKVRSMITQRSLVFEQTLTCLAHYRDTHWKQVLMRYIMADAPKALSGAFDHDKCTVLEAGRRANGSITVTLYRVTPKWLDQADTQTNFNRLYGPQDPSVERDFQKGETKKLKGKNGFPYIFEFRYRSEDCIRSVNNSQPLNQMPSAVTSVGAIVDIAFINDPDFRRIREQDKEERQKMSDAFKNRQAAIAEQQSAQATIGTQVEKRADDARKSNTKRQKPTPEFCDCPDPSHNRPKKKLTLKLTPWVQNGLAKSSKLQGVGEEEPPKPPTPPQIFFSKEPDASKEDSKPPVCTNCKKIKVAKSKRPAFVRKWYAEDDDDQDDDQDDDEVYQEPKLEIGEEVKYESSSETVTSSTAVNAGSDAQEDDEITGSTANGTRAPSPVDDSSQQQKPAGEVSIAINSEATSPSLDQGRQPSFTEPLRSSPEVPNAEQESQTGTSGEMAVAQDQAEADGAVAPQRPEKRAASTTIEQQPPKKPRVNIDLTIDDDDDLIIIKEEP